MSIVTDKVKTYLQKEGIKIFQEIAQLRNPPEDFNLTNIRYQEKSIIVEGLTGLNTDTDGVLFNVQFSGWDADEAFPVRLIAESKFPVKVPTDKREKMISLFNKVNFDTEAAWVTLDMENGEICSRSIIRSWSMDAINDDIIQAWFTTPWEKLDELYPSILDIIQSEKTVEQIFEEIYPYR
jgi:hypothetical protein